MKTGNGNSYGKYHKRKVELRNDGTALVFLTRGFVAVIDSDDFELVSQYTWHATQHKGSTYAATRLRNNEQSHVYLHRMVMNAPDGVEVDHVDRDRLNNRKSNLRLADSSLNGMNKGKGKLRHEATSKYKGVSFDKSRGKWKTSFQFRGKRVEKRFANERDAALFYNALVTAALGAHSVCLNSVNQ